MGWTSTGDSISNLQLEFDTADAAADFCRRNGYDYQIEGDMSDKTFVKKTYAENFKYRPPTSNSWDN